MTEACELGQQAFNEGLNGVVHNPYVKGTIDWADWDEGFDQQWWAYCAALEGVPK